MLCKTRREFRAFPLLRLSPQAAIFCEMEVKLPQNSVITLMVIA